jgi:hypothetical protein
MKVVPFPHPSMQTKEVRPEFSLSLLSAPFGEVKALEPKKRRRG